MYKTVDNSQNAFGYMLGNVFMQSPITREYLRKRSLLMVTLDGKKQKPSLASFPAGFEHLIEMLHKISLSTRKQLGNNGVTYTLLLSRQLALGILCSPD